MAMSTYMCQGFNYFSDILPHFVLSKLATSRLKGLTGSTSTNNYCRTHNVSVCLYIAYIACGSASLYIKTLNFFLTVLALSAAATVANIKIRYDA